ncbi:MAG: hypothetical protein EOO09_21730 [Chitinophagaceae bacterium]|nr:MAG: hypothetical protein EOO09_21730 [Chitinophagaceae bacterium]
MKKSLSALVASLFASIMPLEAAVPAEFAQEFKIVHECIGFSATSARLENDADKLERYWSALKAIGKRIPSPVDQDSPESWSALDRRLLQMARDYASHPERVVTIEGWYSVYYPQEVPRAIWDPEGKMSDEAWERYKNPGSPRRHALTRVELQDRHLTPEYRLSWEAWLLAPRTTFKKMTMTDRCLNALAVCGSDDSIPALMAFFENYTTALAANPQDSSDHVMYNGYAYDKSKTIFLHINTSLSIAAMINVVGMANSAGLTYGQLDKGYYGLPDLSIDQWNKKLFIWTVSGYFETRPRFVKPDFPLLHHRLGRTYLPAIETLLKKEDLAPWKKELLNQTMEVILKHAPELPK